MTYTIERVDTPPHYHVKLHENFDAGKHIKGYFEDLVSKLDTENTPITSIVDLMEIKFSIKALLETTKDLQGININPSQYPMSKQLILISDSPLMRFSIDGFRKFGIVKTVYIVETLEEALNILRSQDHDSA